MPAVEERRSKTLGLRYFVRFRLAGQQTSLTFATRPAAAQFARDVENRGAQTAWNSYWEEIEAADEITLGEYAEHWLTTLTVSPGTLKEYRRDWRLHWEPHLGHLRISRIARTDVVAALKAQTGAPKTIRNRWGTLASILKGAILDGHLTTSPAAGVKLPTYEHHEQTEHRYLNPGEIRQLVADTIEHYRPFIWTLAGTGMRWSEATALTVGDVDLEARTVRISKAWKKSEEPEGARYYIGAPKTRKAKRTVTLPGEVVDALRPLVEGRPKRATLFVNKHGEYVKHQTFYREHWVKRCTRNLAEPRPRIHDLRHSHVAILIAAGAQLPVIQARLGHEKITTTIDTYGHLMPDLQRQAADAADLALRDPQRPPELG